MNKELLNASGAKDLTAYEALKNCEDVLPGQVIKYNDENYYFVVRQTNKKAATVIKMYPDSEYDGDRKDSFSFVCKDGRKELMLTAHPGMVQYVFMSCIRNGKLLMTVDGECLRRTRKMISDALQLTAEADPVKDDNYYRAFYEDFMRRVTNR